MDIVETCRGGEVRSGRMMGRIVCMQVKIYTIELSIKLSLCPNTSSGLDCLKKLCIFPYLTVQLGFSSISFHRITNKLRTNSSSIPDDIKEQLSTLYQNPTPRPLPRESFHVVLIISHVNSPSIQFQEADNECALSGVSRRQFSLCTCVLHYREVAVAVIVG